MINFGRWPGAILNLVLPRACAACDRLLSEADKGIVCGLCWSRVEWLPQPQCMRCGHPLTEGECKWCQLLPPYVRAVRSCCWFPGSSTSRIVEALKYGGWPCVADEMAQRMVRTQWPSDVLAEAPIVIPVPLSASRTRERGFNQSALLATAIARFWRLRTVLDCLARSRATASQTRLNPEERARNVASAFVLRDASALSLQGSHVLLVDDVVTTASTLNACAETLYSGGIRIISYITFGRARSLGDIT